jgi:hypothetical protein
MFPGGRAFASGEPGLRGGERAGGAAFVRSGAYPVVVASRLISILLAALVITLAAAPSASSAAASAAPGDVAATSAYLRAASAALRAAVARLPATNAAVVGLTHRIVGECPLAAAGSPQNEDSEQISNELVGALTVTGYRTEAGPIAAFAHAVKGLHWSNRRLTRAVRTSAAKLRGLSTLAVPEVCGDVRAWAAAGFRTLPAGTVQFDKRYSAVDVEAEEVPLRLLAPYERGSDGALVRRIERFEATLGEFEANAVEYYVSVMDTLELHQ